MPVQINEMVIRAKITEEHEKEHDKGEKTVGDSSVDKDEIVKECAALIMEMLNEKNQR